MPKLMDRYHHVKGYPWRTTWDSHPHRSVSWALSHRLIRFPQDASWSTLYQEPTRDRFPTLSHFSDLTRPIYNGHDHGRTYHSSIWVASRWAGESNHCEFLCRIGYRYLRPKRFFIHLASLGFKGEAEARLAVLEAKLLGTWLGQRFMCCFKR